MKKRLLKFNLNTVWILMAVVFALSLIPLFSIAKYAIPFADDYSGAVYSVPIWEETHSIFAVIAGSFRNMIHMYNNWSGVYTCMFFFYLCPTFLADPFYQIWAILSYLAFLVSLYFFVSAALQYFTNAKRTHRIAIYLFIATLCLQFLPAPNEAHYWLAATTAYTLSFDIMALYLGGLLRYLKRKRESKRTVLCYFLLPILAFLLGGCYYPLSLTGLVVAAVLFVYSAFRKKPDWLILGSCAVCAAGIVLVAMSPGTAVRSAYFTQLSPIHAILKAIKHAYQQIWLFTQPPLMRLVIFASIPFLWQTARKQRWLHSIQLRLLFVFLSPIIIAIGYTPPFYAMSNAGPGRLNNVQFYIYTLVLYLDLYLLIGLAQSFLRWINENILSAVAIKKEAVKEAVRKQLPRIVLAYYAIILLVCCRVYLAEWDAMFDSASFSALRSIRTGEAALFKQEQDARNALYNDPEIKDVVVPALTAHPPLLYAGDIGRDPNAFPNAEMARFFHKDSIALDSE